MIRLEDVVSVSGIALDIHNAELSIADTLQLTATITPADATNKNVVWTTSNEAVATVSASGMVTAVAAGQVVIFATTEDGNYTDSCSIVVTVPVETIKLNTDTVKLNVGETFQMVAVVYPENATNKDIVWTIENESIATIDENGLITAVSEGVTGITATAADNPDIWVSANVIVSAVESALDNVDSSTCTKIFEDGQVYIIRDGVKITVTGVRVE